MQPSQLLPRILDLRDTRIGIFPNFHSDIHVFQRFLFILCVDIDKRKLVMKLGIKGALFQACLQIFFSFFKFFKLSITPSYIDIRVGIGRPRFQRFFIRGDSLFIFYFMKRWLENFPYRSKLGLDIFIFSVTLTFVLALLTVSYQSIKAATANPVDSLRYE